jgi:hypothetical protein
MQNSQISATTLTIRPRRRQLITTLITCLIVLGLIGEVVLSVLQAAYGPVIDVVFSILLLVCVIYLLGFAWSALSLLVTGQPSLEADKQSLRFHHLPFIGTLILPWSEMKSLHTYRYLFLTYLCIVPEDVNQLLSKASIWRFALNASARFSLRTNAPLNVSQGLFDRPATDLLMQLHKTYGVKRTEDTIKRPDTREADGD